MSKAVKITILIASILVVTGIIIGAIALAKANWNWAELQDGYEDAVYEEKNYSFAVDDVKDINIVGVADDAIIIIDPEIEDIQVTVYDTQYFEYTVEVRGQALSIIYDDDDDWFSWFDFDGFTSPSDIEVKLPADFTIENDLKITLVSGNIELSNIEAKELKADTVSGNINIEDCSFDETLLNAISGNGQINNLISLSMTTDSVSGEMIIDNSSIDKLNIDTVSGDVRIMLVGSDDEYQIKTDSISGKILSDRGNENANKTISVDTVSGDIDIDFLP